MEVQTSAFEETHSALTQLFIAAAKSVAARLARLSIPMTVDAPRITIERVENGYSTGRRDEQTNALRRFEIELRGAPWLSSAEVVLIDRCAQMVLDLCAQNLPFRAAGAGRAWLLVETIEERSEPPDFANDPVDWVSRMVIQSALRFHLFALPGVDRADEAAAAAFADDVLEVGLADDLKYVTLVPLSGVDLASGVDSICINQLTVRCLSEAEQGDWYHGAEENGLWRVEGYPEPPRVLLEMRSAGPRDDWYHPPRERTALFVVSSYLHGHGVTGTVVAEKSESAWVTGSSHNGPLAIPRHASGVLILTEEMLQDVTDTAKALENFDLTEPRSSKDLALHRFATGIVRASTADALLDFTIALEALLLPVDKGARHSDLSYRFRVHGSLFLTESASDREPTFRQLNDLYGMRSDLVHGGKYPSAGRIQEMRTAAYEMLRRGLLRALRDGFPTAETFKAMILHPGTP